jgi:small subunit ribosomal protein S18
MREREKDTGTDNSLRKVIRNKYRTDLKGDHFFDYKDPGSLSRYISEGGKITPARISKLSLNQQKKLASAVKKARNLALLPNGAPAYDEGGIPEMISPKPFTI